MKRFQFRLDKVVKFKQRRERQAEIRQKQMAAAVQAAQVVEETLRDNLDRTCLQLQEKLGKAQDATMWMAIYAQSVRLEQALQSARQKVEVANQQLAQAAVLRKQAAIEVEMLLTLRQKQWQEYRNDCQKSAQSQLDDVVIMRWLAAKKSALDGDGLEGAET